MTAVEGGRNTSAMLAQCAAPPPVVVQLGVAELAGALVTSAQPLFWSFGHGEVSGVSALESKMCPPPDTALIVLLSMPSVEMMIPPAREGVMAAPEKLPAAAWFPLAVALPAVES